MNSNIIKSHDNRIQILDCLKGFSIFTIVLMHVIQRMPSFPVILKTLSSIGGTGVHVFFFCSGAGLYYSFLNGGYSTYIGFLKSRFTRIYLPYIVIVLLSSLVPFMYSDNDRITALLSHIFLFKMFIPKYEGSFGKQFWFVSTIIQFYFVFIPLCRLKTRLKNRLFLFVSSVISIAWWCICYFKGVSQIRVWNGFFFQYFWEFSLGMVIADELFHGKEFNLDVHMLLIISVVGIGLQGCLVRVSNSLKVFNDIPALFGYTSIALLFITSIPFIKNFTEWLSSISYELYLIHFLVLESVLFFVKSDSIFIQASCGLFVIMSSFFLALYLKLFFKKIVVFFRDRGVL